MLLVGTLMSELALELISKAKKKELTSLDLGHCGLTELPDELFELIWLEELNLANTWTETNPKTWEIENKKSKNKNLPNAIKTISKKIENLKRLRTLIIAGNKITDLKSLSKLQNISILNISKNDIKDLTPITEMIAKGIPVLTENKHYREKIIVEGNNLEKPPMQIVEKGNIAILNYFKSLESEKSIHLNEAKLIIVGEPGAGKTTLARTLLNPSYEMPFSTESTLGFEVREAWKFPHFEKPDEIFTANIWDFGGQQIQYMTHQFFLTPGAAYVLVSSNDRKEPTNFPYWFQIIHLLGKEHDRYSPVTVVLNEKNDKFINKFNFDQQIYKELYPELKITVCEVNLSRRDAQYDAMREKIQSTLCSLKHVTYSQPIKWKKIRESLRETSKNLNYISLKDYKKICNLHEVKDTESQELSINYLHLLGSLLYFHSRPELSNLVILNPQWIVDAVYSVISDNRVASQGGYFNLQTIEEIWKTRYPPPERAILLKLMKNEDFGICYPVDYDQTLFIAPQLLDYERPKSTWNKENKIAFRIQYDFMPEGIISRLILRLNQKIARNADGKQLVWKKGAILVDNNCSPLVQEKEGHAGSKTIDIYINGNTSQKNLLLQAIRTEIVIINKKWFHNIPYQQMIPCVCSYCINSNDREKNFFDYDTLERAKERGIDTILCDRDFIEISIKNLLGGFFSTYKQQIQSSTQCLLSQGDNDPTTHNQPKPTGIFLSYSHKNKFQAAQLVKLLENKGYQVWWDRDLTAGDRFPEEIKARLIAANCVVVLWSQDAIKSDWVPEEARLAHTSKKLVPAMLENIELPLPFTGSHAANLVNWLGDEQDPNLQQLLNGIIKLTSS